MTPEPANPLTGQTPVRPRRQLSPAPRWLTAGFLLGGLASISGLAYMLSTAVQMLASGRGLETYRTFWLVEFNWLGFLVSCAAIVIALVVAAFLRLREYLQWRSLERKYRVPGQ